MLFSLHDYFSPIAWRFVLADKAKRFVAMTLEERKEKTCRLYAKVFQSDEALHVGILQKIKNDINNSNSWFRKIIFEIKNNSWYQKIFSTKITPQIFHFFFLYLKKIVFDTRSKFIKIDFFFLIKKSFVISGGRKYPQNIKKCIRKSIW